jgi:hypothetical protein
MINNIYTNVLGLALVIFGAIVWEKYNDRKGDLNKREDVFYRGALMFLAANINTLLNVGANCEDWRRTVTFLLLSLNLSVSSFFLIFDYWISYALLKNKTIELPNGSRETWFTYRMGGGLAFWKKASPRTRFFIRLGYFVVSLVIYFIWR